MRRALVWGLGLWLIGCGKQTGTTPPQAEKVSFDIKNVWIPAAKKCAGRDVPLKPHEAYKLDSQYLVAVEGEPGPLTRLCKVGYVYSRQLVSFSSDNASYSEESTLLAAGAKRTCWKLENGHTVEPPLSDDVIEFKADPKPLRLKAIASAVHLEIGGSAECPSGTLTLELKKN
jgi:hypothetical protein